MKNTNLGRRSFLRLPFVTQTCDQCTERAEVIEHHLAELQVLHGEVECTNIGQAQRTQIVDNAVQALRLPVDRRQTIGRRR